MSDVRAGLLARLLACSSAGAQDNAEVARPVLSFPEITAYLTDPKWRYQIHSSRWVNYVVPAELAVLIEGRKKMELLEAVALYSDADRPPQPGRKRELATIILSGVQATTNGWMTDTQRRSGAKVFKVSVKFDKALAGDLPKGDTAAEWADYIKSGRALLSE